MEFKLALIGFGVVGQGLTEILLKQEEELRNTYGLSYKIVAVADKLKGSVYDPNGLDLGKLLDLVKVSGSIEDYPGGSKGWSSEDTIVKSNANLVVEVSWTDINTGEPAITHVKTALKNKKHVVMTN
ncbi:MAG: homoserine dehydrogenase, partial [Candidatus Thorarchaeota archaeon]